MYKGYQKVEIMEAYSLTGDSFDPLNHFLASRRCVKFLLGCVEHSSHPWVCSTEAYMTATNTIISFVLNDSVFLLLQKIFCKEQKIYLLFSHRY